MLTFRPQHQARIRLHLIPYLIRWRKAAGVERVLRRFLIGRVPENLDRPELGVDELPVELVAVEAAAGREEAAAVADPGREVEGGGFPWPGADQRKVQATC